MNTNYLAYDISASTSIDKFQLSVNVTQELYFLKGALMDQLADKGTRFVESPHLQMDSLYLYGGPFNQLSALWPIKPATYYITDSIDDLPLLNLDFKVLGMKDTQDFLPKTNSCLIHLADKPPDIKPPFWRIFAKHRWFCTSIIYLISLIRILVKCHPEFHH